MATESENRPHVVFNKDQPWHTVELFPTYREAFRFWEFVHNFEDPHTIATLGRECTPAAAIIDVNE